MRTTPEENAAIGRWIGERLNACEGPVRFLLPEGGVSLIDAAGQAVPRPGGGRGAVRGRSRRTVRQTERRRVDRLPYAINDPAFAAALVAAFREVAA